MPIVDDKEQQIIDRVISKIHWGARETEVRDWLEKEKGIVGFRADEMIQLANRRRANEIRGRAMVSMVFGAVGVLFGGALIIMQAITGIFFVVRTTLAVGILISSLVYFFKSLGRFISGRTLGQVDR